MPGFTFLTAVTKLQFFSKTVLTKYTFQHILSATGTYFLFNTLAKCYTIYIIRRLRKIPTDSGDIQMTSNIAPLLATALGETIRMVIVSMIAATAVGIPIGVLLVTTAKHQILECVPFNRVLAAIINAVRSIPFIILMVAIIPFTRLVAGTSIGTNAAMVPLTIAAIPFIARQVETSLKEVPYGLIEAALSMGATPMQIIRRVYLPEAMPGIVAQLTTVVIALVGASAMAGTIGGGGLGDLAIRYGYQRFRPDVMIATILVLLVLVQLIQFSGNKLAKHLDKK